ncbi:general amino acid permease [Aspergillus homomorphus CBS 101889]|uniref:General amino acid permease n=1 Tax=Aspergillus homomorphus (strain CBS 101889) TaxID=1450537 RepID=A0A395I4V4_ASPHC|nr:general amino acid permease [Aspergillus homomorphus CBS 101889]RAL14769.1 general amino acid permease [Aspergillus homomorphus CBS 101889]
MPLLQSPVHQIPLATPTKPAVADVTSNLGPWIHPHLEQGVVPVKGRQLRASKPIQRGERLLVDTPYAVIPAVDDPSTSDALMCSNPTCNRRMPCNANRIACPKTCLADVMWCSEACQAADHSRHEFECTWLHRFAASIRSKWGEYEFGMLWLIVRILAARQLELSAGESDLVLKGTDTAHGRGFAQGWQAMQSFCGSEDSWSHAQVRSWTALVKKYLRASPALPHNLPDSDVVKLICQEEANSFGLYPRETGLYPVPPDALNRGEQFGAAVYPRAAIANHSCGPNIMHQPDQHGRMVFTAAKDIAAGEECCISYFDLTKLTDLKARREHLQTLFRFVCQCPRCQSEEPPVEEPEWVAMPFGDDDRKQEPPDMQSSTTKIPDTVVEEERVLSAGSQHLHRKLRGKEVQLLAVGGAIGTSLFVQMGAVLPKGGPAGLLLGFVAYGTIILAVNQCFAEMVCFLPIPSPFVQLAGHWVDDALGFAMGWNFFLTMALGIPYEIVAINVLLTYWTDRIPVAAVVVAVMVIYGILNTLTVRYFGVAEFYLSICKIVLMLGLICYTFVTMVGGNPHHDAYGFRYWKDPGAFVSYLVAGNTGRFCGVLACMIQASFTMVGPEYISMTAAEAERPRVIMHRAYSSFVWRLMIFFIAGALCMGIVLPYDDPTLAATIAGTRKGSGTGAASPYVISMTHLSIPVLPHIVNLLILTSVLSAGNNLIYSASRTLHGLALTRKAPAIFTHCTARGLPIYAILVTMAFCLLAFLQVQHTSATVLNWLVSVITASYLLNYFGTCVTYLHFYAALKAQGVDRRTLPYRGYLQPYAGWLAVVGTGVMVLVLGWEVFLNGRWSIETFILDYAMIAVFVVLGMGWKLGKRTGWVRPEGADLGVKGLRAEIDEYERLVGLERSKKKPSWRWRAFDRWFE